MHKFKLKKDGEVVGYMVLKPIRDDGELEWRYFDGDFSRESIYAHHCFDTAEPFVCLDKNKDEVYAGDEVCTVCDKGRVKSSSCIVIYDNLQWMALGVFGVLKGQKIELRYYDIELIKD